MKHLFFGLFMAFACLAFAGNTPNIIGNDAADTVQEFADMHPNAGNVTDAIHTLPGSTKANTFKAADPALQGKTLDHAPFSNDADINDDCVRVTQNDGIFIIDCGDICRVASPSFGLTPSDFEAQMSCCLVILVGLDGEDLRVTVTNTDTGQTADFPICN